MNTSVKSGLRYGLLSLCSATIPRKVGKVTNLISAGGSRRSNQIDTQVADVQPKARFPLSTLELSPLALLAFQA